MARTHRKLFLNLTQVENAHRSTLPLWFKEYNPPREDIYYYSHHTKASPGCVGWESIEGLTCSGFCFVIVLNCDVATWCKRPFYKTSFYNFHWIGRRTQHFCHWDRLLIHTSAKPKRQHLWNRLILRHGCEVAKRDWHNLVSESALTRIHPPPKTILFELTKASHGQCKVAVIRKFHFPKWNVLVLSHLTI